MPANEVTVTANWTAVPYTITYNLDGGVNNESNPSRYTVEDSAITLEPPTRTGYTFEGWYESEDFSGSPVTTITAGSIGNKEYWALWKLNEYVITFDPNGGEVSKESDTTGAGWKLSSLPTPTRSGYIFSGWSTAKTTDIKVDTSTVFSADTTIYAQWTLITYEITFNSNGGEAVTPASGTTGEGWKLSSLPTPTRSGYTFSGWFTDSTGGTAVSTNTVFSSETTIYAQWWSPFNPDITYDTLTDTRDGTIYRTVEIGSQVWMAENLNFDTTGSYCYGNSTDSCAKYGRLYTWSAAMAIEEQDNSTLWNGSDKNHQGVCPAGWHLPNNAEWDSLMVAVGGVKSTYWNYAGTKLKSQVGWNYYISGVPAGTNEYGFSALPGGFRDSDGYFSTVGNYGYWWSATEYDAGYAWYWGMNYSNSYVFEGWNYKSYGRSVRCLRD